MKRYVGTALVLAIGSIISVGSARAADMAVKAPPIAAVPCTWCGFYAGVNGGGAWFDDGSAIANETSAGAPFISGWRRPDRLQLAARPVGVRPRG